MLPRLRQILFYYLWMVSDYVLSQSCDTDRDIRVVSHNDTAGTVELCYGGVWQMVCDDFWDERDAKVACYQLGFSRHGAISKIKNFYNTHKPSQPVVLDDLECNGDENNLFDCPRRNNIAIGVENCNSQSEKSAVICKVLPSQIILSKPFPEDFLGVSTRPACLGGRSALICNPEDIILRDGVTGSERDNNIDPTEFLAWNESSGIVLQCEEEGNVNSVRAINMYIYYDPNSGAVLPNFYVSGSHFDSQAGDSLSYTVVWNQDTTASVTTGVQNVTLNLTQEFAENFKYLHIRFDLENNLQQFIISELIVSNIPITWPHLATRNPMPSSSIGSLISKNTVSTLIDIFTTSTTSTSSSSLIAMASSLINMTSSSIASLTPSTSSLITMSSPPSTTPTSTNTESPTESATELLVIILPIIIGVFILIMVLLILIFVSVMLRNKLRKKPTTAVDLTTVPSASNVMALKTKELEDSYTKPSVTEPVYDCVVPPQSRVKMEMKENTAYGLFDSSRYESIDPRVMPNIAYGEVRILPSSELASAPCRQPNITSYQ